MGKPNKMKIKKRSLDVPMTQHDFQQLTLIANLMAICKRLIDREVNAERRGALSILMRDTRRIESSIVGYLDPRIAEGVADKFYNRMGDAVDKFLSSFEDTKPAGIGDIDDALNAIFDVTDDDSYVIQSILQFCHEHQGQIQEWMAVQAAKNSIEKKSIDTK